jgi:hypothetical protein
LSSDIVVGQRGHRWHFGACACFKALRTLRHCRAHERQYSFRKCWGHHGLAGAREHHVQRCQQRNKVRLLVRWLSIESLLHLILPLRRRNLDWTVGCLYLDDAVVLIDAHVTSIVAVSIILGTICRFLVTNSCTYGPESSSASVSVM